VLVPLATLSPARAQTRSTPAREDLTELLEPIRAKHDVPALGGAIVKGADLVAIGASGLRARGAAPLVTVNDLWHLGSCTKAMTATLAARLVEQGKLEWSSTLGGVFADLRDEMDAQWRDVTLEMLLQQRGGAGGDPPPQTWAQLWRRDKDEPPHVARRWFVEQLLTQPPAYKPGTKFEYSNQGYTIAGAMLERATGKPWEELMRGELFAPLHMESAGFGPPGARKEIDQPRGHSAIGPIVPGPGADNPPAIGPAGTVHCSLADWAKFVAAHLRGENGVDSVVTAQSFRKLHACPEFQTYAMGWGRDPRKWAGGDTLHHAGSNTMWYCVVWIAPAKDCAFLATTNIGGDVAAKACDAAVDAMRKHVGLVE